jgi:uncharacterized protein
MLDPLVLDVLVDPVDKGSLLYLPERDVLFNPRTRRLYAVTDGIAVLLASESRPVDGDELAAIESELGGAVRTGPPEAADPSA